MLKTKRLLPAVQHWLRTNRADLLVLLFFTVIACIYWYPLPLYLRTAQMEWPVVDPAFNQWIMAWDIHALFHYPARFFESNMFYPYPHTLSWGDHLFSLTLFAIPLVPLIGIVGAYNVLLLGSTALSAFTAYLLIFYLTKNRNASIVGGLLWGFTHYRNIEYGHLQILYTQWIPLVFLYAEKLRQEYSRKHFILFMIFAFLMLATNLYLALFTILSFLTYIFCLMVTRQTNLRTLLRLAVGWAAAGFFAIPLYLPSILLQLQHPIVRGYDHQISIFLHALLPWPWAGHPIREAIEVWDGQSLPPGTYHTLGLLMFPLLVLAIVRLIIEWRKNKNWIILTFLVIGITGLLAGMGPNIRWYETLLTEQNLFYTVPYHFVPGYETLRVPMRWFFLGLLGLAVVVSWGITKPLQKLKTSVQYGLIVLFTLWLLIEQAPLPIFVHPTYKLQDYPSEQWLADQPGEFAILQLPIFPGAGNYYNDVVEARRMYLSTFHWKRRVGGAISPYVPPEYAENAKILNDLGADPQALALLKSWQVQYVIYNPEDYLTLSFGYERSEAVKTRLDAMPELAKVAEFSDATVYRILP